MVSISSLFTYLGMPLVNQRWSWGASNDKCVVLRVWQDEVVKRQKAIIILQEHPDLFNLPGYKERERHIKEIQAGKPCYLIMCEAKDPESDRRVIKNINEKELFVGGELLEIEEGIIAIAYKSRIAVSEFKITHN
jgi:hypothetical protein